MRPPTLASSVSVQKAAGQGAPPATTVRMRMRNTVTMLLSRKMLAIAPLCFYLGPSMAMYGALFNRQIEDHTIAATASMATGVGMMLGAILIGASLPAFSPRKCATFL